MDKQEWFELVEQAELARDAISCGDPQTIVDEVLNLVNLIHYKASDEAEYEGWYSELEDYIDTMTFAD